MKPPPRTGTGLYLLLLLAFVLGFLAIWTDPAGTAASQELSVAAILARPAEFWGRSVRIVGTVQSLGEGSYVLTDRSGSSVAVQSQHPPRLGTDLLVVALVGQDPSNALRPVLVQLDRDSLKRSVEAVLVAVALVLAASTIALALLVRADRRLRRQAVAASDSTGTPSDASSLLRIEVLLGPDRGKIFELDQPEVSIGRPGERANSVSLSDMTISRSQASILRHGAGYLFENESATNPTRINGQVVRRAELLTGDRLEMGETLLRIGLQPRETEAP